MEPRLDRSAFAGSVFDARGAGASFIGEARFAGCFVWTTWARDAVRALLPAALALAPTVATESDAHPVLFIFGEQSEGAILLGGLSVPMGVRYSELGIAVPYVTHRSGRHLHTYVPRMYSSYFPPVYDGNLHYGYRKQLAELQRHGPIVTLTAAGALLWHAVVEPAGAWSRAAAASLPHFTALRNALALPIIGRKSDGRYVRSYFDLGVRDALVRPLRCAISIDAPLIEGLAPQRCASVPNGAFEVRGMLWHLSWPEPL